MNCPTINNPQPRTLTFEKSVVLQVPNKVRNLLWRSYHDAMPTKANLVRRKIIEDPLCDRSHEAHENPLHALWLRKEIDIVWEDSESWAYRRQLQVLSFKELLSWMIVQKQNVKLFAITMWLNWSQRNQVQLNHTATALHQIPQRAKEWLTEFIVCQTTQLARTDSPGQTQILDSTSIGPGEDQFRRSSFSRRK